MKVALISLGCSKNTVNSEQMLWLINNAGYEVVSEPEIADAVVVNTCGFLEAAISEAVAEIIEWGHKKIIVAGCMAERHKEDIFDEMPEVDAIIGTGSYADVVDALRAVEKNQRLFSRFGDASAPIDETERILGTPGFAPYIKIAEGCDNHCAYCVIPSLRGKFRSRPMENILREAEYLIKGGAKEITLIAQDTTRYGLDLYGERKLPELLNKLGEIKGDAWLRLHYLYPAEVTDELLTAVAQNCVPYLDIPIQHKSPKILKSMGRRETDLYELVSRARKIIPDAVLRTTVIVGLPGETDEDFEELCEFLRETEWARAGVFEYSPEEGTKAAEMPDQIDGDTKQKRREIIEDIQREVVDAFNLSKLGAELEILTEGYDRAAGCYYGRSVYDAQDVDGRVFFSSKRKLTAGERVNITVKDTVDGDLWGEAE